LDIPCKVLAIETIRDENGLAISSRNQYLNAENRKLANNINKIMKNAVDIYKNKDLESTIKLVKENFITAGIKKIDYIEIRDNNQLNNIENNDKSNARLFIAVYIDNIRLIDNIKL
jgi:pantoate--beta-alanine ligase